MPPNNYSDETGEPFKDSPDRWEIVQKLCLYRYIPAFRLTDLLTNGMYLPTCDLFEDKREGILPFEACLDPDRLNIQLRSNLSASEKDQLFQSAQYYIKIIQKMRADILVSCWMMRGEEDYLMWKAYGGENTSVRLKVNYFKLYKLFQEFTEQPNVYASYHNHVKYMTPYEAYLCDPQAEIFGLASRDENTGAMLADADITNSLIAGFFIKHHAFSSEKEARFITLIDSRPISPRININSAIEEIVTSPYLEEEEHSKIEELIRSLLPSVIVERSTVNPRQTKIVL